jgi:hypothetical protein
MTAASLDRLETAGDIIRLVTGEPVMMQVLRAVEAVDLSDGWIAAGFVRNAVWDALHDRPWSRSHGDVDVVYFERGDSAAIRDTRIEARLRAIMPGVPWSVRNQARMHLGNGDPPYADLTDALRHWPETCTAVALRSAAGRIELLAPFGISDLLALIVGPTPAFADKIDVYRERVARKQWATRWPKLRIAERSGPGGSSMTCFERSPT